MRPHCFATRPKYFGRQTHCAHRAARGWCLVYYWQKRRAASHGSIYYEKAVSQGLDRTKEGYSVSRFLLLGRCPFNRGKRISPLLSITAPGRIVNRMTEQSQAYTTECAISCQVLPPSVVWSRATISPFCMPPPGAGMKCVRLSANAQPSVGETKLNP